MICPLCKKECGIVSRSSFDHKIKSHFKKHMKSFEYGFCKNIDCDIVYFNPETDEMYFKRDLEEN
jgi:hypothetical protein